MNKTTFVLFFACLFIFFQGCAAWYTLEFETKSQPIQFGPHFTKSGVDTLGVISGYHKQYSEDEVYSESKYVSVTLGGDEYVEENLKTIVYKALEDHPEHFIADGVIEVRVKRGITFWSFLNTMIAGFITGEVSEVGEYSTEVIHFTGIVYRMQHGDNFDDQ